MKERIYQIYSLKTGNEIARFHSMKKAKAFAQNLTEDWEIWKWSHAKQTFVPTPVNALEQ